MKRKHLFALVLGLLLLFSLESFSAIKGKELRLNLEVGKEYKLVSESSVVYFSDASLSEQKMSMNIFNYFTYKVTSKTEEGVHHIDLSVDRVTLMQEISGMIVKYDSDLEEQLGMGAMIAAQFDSLIGSKISFKINALGQVVDRPEADSANPLDLSNSLESLFMEFPEDKLKTGSAWKKETKIQGSPFKINVNYTAEKVLKKEIDLKLSATKDDLSQTDSLDLSSEDFNLSMSGSAHFKTKTGELIEIKKSRTIKSNSAEIGEVFLLSITKVSSIIEQ